MAAQIVYPFTFLRSSALQQHAPHQSNPISGGQTARWSAVSEVRQKGENTAVQVTTKRQRLAVV